MELVHYHFEPKPRLHPQKIPYFLHIHCIRYRSVFGNHPVPHVTLAVRRRTPLAKNANNRAYSSGNSAYQYYTTVAAGAAIVSGNMMANTSPIYMFPERAESCYGQQKISTKVRKYTRNQTSSPPPPDKKYVVGNR